MCLVMVSQDSEYRGLVMVIQGSQYAGLVKFILGSGHMHSLTVSQDSVTWSKLLCHSWLSWSSWSNLRPLACIHLCMQLAPAAALSLHSAFHVLLLISLSTVAAICLVICVVLRSASVPHACMCVLLITYLAAAWMSAQLPTRVSHRVTAVMPACPACKAWTSTDCCVKSVRCACVSIN